MSKRHGYGEQRYGVGTKDVSTYAGHWHENCRHGWGTITYASGNVYQGDGVEVSPSFPRVTDDNGHLLRLMSNIASVAKLVRRCLADLQ